MLCLDTKLLLYIVNSKLVSVAVILVFLGAYCSKIPGPLIAGLAPSVITGLFVCLLAACGIRALRLNQLALMMIYLVALVCIFGAQVIFGVISLAIESQLVVESFLKNSYIVKSKDPDSNVINFQGFFECCGFDGPDGMIFV